MAGQMPHERIVGQAVGGKHGGREGIGHMALLGADEGDDGPAERLVRIQRHQAPRLLVGEFGQAEIDHAADVGFVQLDAIGIYGHPGGVSGYGC